MRMVLAPFRGDSGGNGIFRQRLPCLHIENLRIRVLKKVPVERSNRLFHVVFFDHKTHVDLRCALGNHPDVDVTNGVEHLGSNSLLTSEVETISTAHLCLSNTSKIAFR